MPSLSTKPTILLVPGACHTPNHFSSLIIHLNTTGYPTTTVSLPSVNSSTPNEESVIKDGLCIRSTLEALLDEGKDVILTAHSYGGIPSSVAAKGLMKVERDGQGKKGGIIAQVYIAAFLAPEGVSLLQLAGGKHAPWVVRNVGNTSPLARMKNDETQISK
jgi:pimeloyl-ACP methyl ester carboxylesterase